LPLAENEAGVEADVRHTLDEANRTRRLPGAQTPRLSFGSDMPCAESRIICARRHVTTDPDDLRTIRSSFCPSSGSMSRTRTRSAMQSIIQAALRGTHQPRRPKPGQPCQLRH